VIAPNPENLRDDALDSAEKRDEMINSLKTVGLIQAVVLCDLEEYVKVRPEHAHRFAAEIQYVLLAGERRWLGAKDAGWKTIRGEVQNELLQTMDEVFIHENGGRVDLNPFQEAEGYRRLQLAGHSLTDIGERSNKSKAHVSKRLRLLELEEDARSLVLTGELSIDTAYNLLAALGDKPQLVAPAWGTMKQEGLAVREAAQRLLARPESSPAPAFSSRKVPVTQGAFLAETPPSRNAEPPSTSSSPPTPPETSKAHSPGATGDEEHDRAVAAEARSKHCQILISAYRTDSSTPQFLRIAQAAVAHAPRPALDLAHRWLVALGDTEAEALDSKAYAKIMISSSDTQRVSRLAYAMALADAEVRAGDRRRKWDPGVLAHIRHLIDAAGYSPQSAWERQQLGLASAAS
jgi:ParB/RepB/Spo0J family partition protein